MIIQTRYTVADRVFIRTESDAGRYVIRDGVSYCEANDPAEYNRQYTEGEIMNDDVDDSEALEILLGGAT